MAVRPCDDTPAAAAGTQRCMGLAANLVPQSSALHTSIVCVYHLIIYALADCHCLSCSAQIVQATQVSTLLQAVVSRLSLCDLKCSTLLYMLGGNQTLGRYNETTSPACAEHCQGGSTPVQVMMVSVFNHKLCAMCSMQQHLCDSSSRH